MQRIERYGVIALVFLLVTILAVAVWGQRKNQSLLSFLKRDKTSEVAKLETPIPDAPTQGSPIALSNSSHDLKPLSEQPSAAGAGDPALRFAPVAGPGANAVTFEPPVQAGASNTPGSGFLTDPTARTAVPGAQTPSGPVVVPAQPIESAPRMYKVKAGDTLGSIAQHELGSTKRWQEIETLNNVKADRLNVGMMIKLPAGGASSEAQVLVKKDEPAAPADASATASKRTYSVRSGDSLSKIAAAQLGDANRYGEILALNPGLNPQKLSVGQSLRLPAGAKTPAPVAKPKAHPASETSEVAKADPTPKKARVQ